jgi:hypothetical protein
MTQSPDQNVDVLRSMPPLLSAESANEFAALRKGLKNEIKPEGVIEQIYVDEFATHIWEIQRFRHYKAIILNNSRLAALQEIVEQLLRDQDFQYNDRKNAADDLARGWFENNKAKTQVATLMRKFGLDEGAIEAEAFRLCAEYLERLDRILTGLEFRRDRALRFIAEYRKILSKQLGQAGDRILDNDDVPRLVAVGKRSD